MTEINDKNIASKQLKIMFCLPGTTFSHNFLKSWTSLIMWCFYNNIKIFMSNFQSSNVYYVRNLCLGGDVLNGKNQKPFQGKIDYDYIMWIDSDQVFNLEHFKKLLYADKDIIAGLYRMQNSESFACVQNWDKEYFKKKGAFEFLNPEIIKSWKEKTNTNLMKVSYTGFGWILIKKKVFESLEYPWFRPLWHTISQKSETNEEISDFSSEDVSWCKLVIKNGYNIWVDTSVIVGHEKMIIL